MAGFPFDKNDIVRLLSAFGLSDNPQDNTDSLAGGAAAPSLDDVFGLAPGRAAELIDTRLDINQQADLLLEPLAAESTSFAVLGHDDYGHPARHLHTYAALAADADILAQHFPSINRIVCCVAPYTDFGLIAGVLVPKVLDIPVLDLHRADPSQIVSALCPGDMLIAEPVLWGRLVEALETISLPENIAGLSGYDALPRPIIEALLKTGFTDIHEAYGSLPTLSIGWKTSQMQAFRLLPVWHRLEDGRLARNDQGQQPPYTPVDLLIWDPAHPHDNQGPRQFRPMGRRDSAVRIGSQFVSPAKIASIICDHPQVIRCSVRIAQDHGMERLRAHVTLDAGIEPSEAIVRSIEKWCRSQLDPAERPRLFCFDVTEAPPVFQEALRA